MSSQAQDTSESTRGSAPRVEKPERAVARAQKVVDGIMHELSGQLLSHELYSESTGEGMRISARDAVRYACRRRMHEADGSVLSYIDALLSSDHVASGQPGIAELLVAVRDEFLELASEQMSSEVRVVDLAAKTPSTDVRQRIAHTAVSALPS